MKVVKDKIPVTRWMLFKAKARVKLELIKLFLIKFFDIKQMAYAIFTYDILCKHKNPKRQEHIVLAKVSRNATPDEIKKKLFTLKGEEDCKLIVVCVKLKPIGVIKSV